MGFISDLLKFENFNLKDMGRKIKDNPARLLYGAGDEFGTKIWNKVLGRNDEPIVNKWGGADEGAYRRAEEAGINTKAGRTGHQIAETIAALYAGNAAAKGMGMGGGSAAAGGGEAASAANATNPALIESAVGTAGYGASSAGAGGGAAGIGSAASAPGWTRFLPMSPGGQSQPQQPIKEAPVIDTPTPEAPESWGRLLSRYNANEGAMADGRRIQVNGGTATLLDEDGRVIGRAPNNQALYDAMASMTTGQG